MSVQIKKCNTNNDNFRLIVVISNSCSVVFLFMNVTTINADAVVEGAIITNGLTIISLVATVWIRIS